MFTVECAFRITPTGLELRLDDDPPEDEMCELGGIFRIIETYGPERDVGAGVTWDSKLEIGFRALGEQWRPLKGHDELVAQLFLGAHCRPALDEAEREAALEIYYGDE